MSTDKKCILSEDLENKKNPETESFHQEFFYDEDSADEAEYENTTKVNYKIFDNCEYYNNNVEEFALQQMIKFFDDKELHCGGKIPHSILSNTKRVNIVINLDLDSSIKIFYEFSEKTISEDDLARSRRTGEVSWDIIAVNEVLKILAQSGVPQQFAGGMLLLYLELVKGHDIKL